MTSLISRPMLALVLAAALATPAFAQQPPAAIENGAANLALVLLPTKGGAPLTVTSPAFKFGGDIPFENTQYRGNAFPGLSWTAGPAGTKTYVIIMQDGDSRNANPFLHWVMFNIPPSSTTLEAGMTAAPAGSQYGPNYKGANQPYLGPRTPAGPKHRYHLQVFALDAALTLDATATLADLLAAMKEHVLASGELVGLGQAPPPPGP